MPNNLTVDGNRAYTITSSDVASVVARFGAIYDQSLSDLMDAAIVTGTSDEVASSRRSVSSRMNFQTIVNEISNSALRGSVSEVQYADDDIVHLKDGKLAKFKDCCIVRDVFYLKTDKKIIEDEFAGGYTLVDYASAYIKDFTAKGDPITGFTDNMNTRFAIPIFHRKFSGHILDPELLKKIDVVEDLRLGAFTNPDNPDLKQHNNNINSITEYTTFKNPFNRITDLGLKFKLGMKSPSYAITEGMNYTFGIELEVSRGFIPVWKAYYDQLNVTCVRDGSLNDGNGGAEYVTGVLTGDTGFNQVQNLCLELSKRSRVNNTCGMHLHIGNIDFTSQFLVNSYILALLIEDEVFSFLPESRRNNRYCKRLKKFKFRVALDGSKKNLDLEEDYNTLFRYIAVEKVSNPNFEYNKSKQHPMGAKCGYNHSTPRYCWINYVPAMFNTRGDEKSKSIEIRNHSGTTNFTKVKNWTLLFMAFCKFVEEYPHLIKPGITVENILDKVLPKKAKSLMVYFNTRKKLFLDNPSEEIESSNDTKKSIKELINN